MSTSRRWSSLLVVLALGFPLAAEAQTVSGVVRNGGRGIENAAVYLVPLDEGPAVRTGPTVTIDQTHLTFVPNAIVVAPGTEVAFVNSDDVLHNVFGPGLGGVDGFDLGTYPRDVRRAHTFRQEGLHIVLCHIHPEMAAFIIVAPTRYTASTADDGSFSIRDVPPGRYELHAWHPRHWRNEHVEDVVVPVQGLRGIPIVLGRTGGPVSDS